VKKVWAITGLDTVALKWRQCDMEYPDEFFLLEKGRTVPESIIEKVIQKRRVDCTEDEWSLKILNVGSMVERFWRTQGQQITWVVDRKGLRICDDEEASRVNFRRTENHLRGLHRDHRRNIGVDMAGLENGVRERHMNSVARQGAVLSAIKATRAF